MEDEFAQVENCSLFSDLRNQNAKSIDMQGKDSVKINI